MVYEANGPGKPASVGNSSIRAGKMTLWYYDRRKQKRDFFTEKGACEITGSVEDIKKAFETAGVEDGDVVFVHTDYEPPWIAYGKHHQGAHIVFMSSEPNRLELPADAPKNLHVCDYPINDLGRYPRIHEFFRTLENGDPNWSLLAQLFFGEALVSWYLLEVAAEHMGQADEERLNPLKGELQQKASEQYAAHCKRLGLSEDILTRENVQKVFHEIQQLNAPRQ